MQAKIEELFVETLAQQALTIEAIIQMSLCGSGVVSRPNLAREFS